MDKDRLTLSKQYLFGWFHGQPLTPEQTEAFLGFLEWKPLNDPILKGHIIGASRKRIEITYSEKEKEHLEAASLFFTSALGPWRERCQKEYAKLNEEELWTKFNSFYLTFLTKHNPATEVCYAKQLPSRADGIKKSFDEYPAAVAAEPEEEPEFVPTARSWLLEAGWEWQAIRMLLERVSEGMSTALAYELLIRIIERAPQRPTRRERLDAFVRDVLRRSSVTKTKLAGALGLSTDQVRRAERRQTALHTADEIAQAQREIETLILELRREAENLF